MSDARAAADAGLARPLALSFLAGAAVMAAELAAPRLVAPHLGAGFWAWSAVLAVFLAGMALGSRLGGRLADGGRPRTLPALFVVAGLGVAAAVPLDAWLRAGALDGLPHAARTWAAVAAAFGPGAFGCGLVGPALGRAVLAASPRPGSALGLVGAASAVGSVVGTFVTGFLLVPHAGTRAIYLGAAAVLLACVPMAASLPAAARRAPGPRPAPLPRAWPLLAVLAGATLLVIEVVASRVAANRLGSSVYTWTSVLGVVLLALALGNALGGRLADRHEPRRLLGRLLLFASAAVASCLWTPALMTRAVTLDLAWSLRTLLAVAAGFLLPALAVGTLTPVVVRAALREPAADGRTVGRLYALGTWGAVGGSLLAGLVLVPWLQVPLLIVVLALGLALASWRLGGRGELPWIGTLAAVGLLIALPLGPVRDLGLALGVRQDRPGTTVEDSRYFRIGVEPHPTRWVRLREPLDAAALAADPLLQGALTVDEDRGLLFWRGPMSAQQAQALQRDVRELGNREAARELAARAGHDVRLLSLDRFVHGFVDLQDPLWLEYEYEILSAALVRELWPRRAGSVHAFFIGGGAYTFQRRLLSLYGERASLVTAEIDPAVTRVAMEQLGLASDPRHRVLHEDARTALRRFDDEDWGFDLVFGDAFHDLGVPWHLTTEEFAREVKARMAPDGVYLVNVIDLPASLRFLRAFRDTVARAFSHVRVLTLAGGDPSAQRTYLLVASDAAPAWGTLTDDAGRTLQVEELGPDRLPPGDTILTDDHAPVEVLLAPAVRARAASGLRRTR